jgi:hypothetical protein
MLRKLKKKAFTCKNGRRWYKEEEQVKGSI